MKNNRLDLFVFEENEIKKEQLVKGWLVGSHVEIV